MNGPSVYLRAYFKVAEHPAIRERLMEIVNIQAERVDWLALDYGVLSGGQKVLASWAFTLFSGEGCPATWRDPLVDFGALDPQGQELVVRALRIRFEMGGVL
jgi:hypothetical protein